MRTALKAAWLLTAAGAALAMTPGCERKPAPAPTTTTGTTTTGTLEGAAERTGMEIRENADAAKDAIRDSAAKAGDAIDKNADSAMTAMKKAKDDLVTAMSRQMDVIQPQMDDLKSKVAGVPEASRSAVIDGYAALERQWESLSGLAKEARAATGEAFDRLQAEFKAAAAQLESDVAAFRVKHELK